MQQGTDAAFYAREMLHYSLIRSGRITLLPRHELIRHRGLLPGVPLHFVTSLAVTDARSLQPVQGISMPPAILNLF